MAGHPSWGAVGGRRLWHHGAVVIGVGVGPGGRGGLSGSSSRGIFSRIWTCQPSADRGCADAYTTKTEPSYDDMTVKLRRVIIAARFRSPCPDQTGHPRDRAGAVRRRSRRHHPLRQARAVDLSGLRRRARRSSPAGRRTNPSDQQKRRIRRSRRGSSCRLWSVQRNLGTMGAPDSLHPCQSKPASEPTGGTRPGLRASAFPSRSVQMVPIWYHTVWPSTSG